MNSLYAAVNAPSASTARIGLLRFIVSVQNFVHSFAPSRSAASYSSRGRESKKPLSRKIEKPLAMPGRTRAQNVLSRETVDSPWKSREIASGANHQPAKIPIV